MSAAGQGLEEDTETKSGVTAVHKGTGRVDVSDAQVWAVAWPHLQFSVS